MHSRILLVGTRNKNVHTGMGAAFELLIAGLQNRGYRISIVNTRWGGKVKSAGTLGFKRVLVIAVCVLHAYLELLRSQTLYMPISTSRLGFYRDLLIIRFASLLHRRIVIHLHGSGLKPFYEQSSPRLQAAICRTYSKVDCFIVLGELLKDQFDFADNWQEKTKVVLNGTPVQDSAIPASLVKNPPSENEPWQLLYLSNLMVTKGYLELLSACELLLDQGYDNFQCHFCGEFLSNVVEGKVDANEKRKAKFLDVIAKPGLKDHVFYHATVSGDEKSDQLRAAHLLILPTYYPWEGQPLSINEALAWSTPVVTTHHKGIPEQILEGKNGYFVEQKDAKALAVCLSSFFQGEVPYQELSRQSRRHYEENFTNEVHLERLIELLEEGTSQKS